MWLHSELVVFGAILGAGLVLALYVSPAAIDPVTAASAGGGLATAAGVILAYRVFRTNIRRSMSSTHLENSSEVLLGIRETFVSETGDVIENDRALWIRVARMISRFEQISALVTESDHLIVLEEREESCRHAIAMALRLSRASLTAEYFAAADRVDGPVHRKAMAVVYGFSKWKYESPDPLGAVDDVELWATGALPIDHHGAEQFLEDQYPEYWARVQARRAELEQGDS
jgi:hypothetical protein